MAKNTSVNGASVVDSDTLASLREAAQAGDASAALELYQAQKASGKERGKWDPRTATAIDGESGDQFGVVTWMPNDSDTKYHYVIRVHADDGRIEIIHNANGKPLTLGSPAEMKTFISAMQMAGVIK